jgi:hypothetical protein
MRLAVEELRSKIDERVATLKSDPLMREIIDLQTALNALEKLLNEPPTSLGQLMNLGAAPDDTAPLVRFDEFVGLEPLDAAKRYLKKRTDARPFTEIIEAIKRGGGSVGSEDALRTGLSRSTFDIIKIGDRYGWLENYPQVKRGKTKRKADVGTPDVTETPEEGTETATGK